MILSKLSVQGAGAVTIHTPFGFRIRKTSANSDGNCPVSKCSMTASIVTTLQQLLSRGKFVFFSRSCSMSLKLSELNNETTSARNALFSPILLAKPLPARKSGRAPHPMSTMHPLRYSEGMRLWASTYRLCAKKGSRKPFPLVALARSSKMSFTSVTGFLQSCRMIRRQGLVPLRSEVSMHFRAVLPCQKNSSPNLTHFFAESRSTYGRICTDLTSSDQECNP